MPIEAIGAPAAAAAVDVNQPADDNPKPIGLRSPPDSNNAMEIDVDGSDSELSDLDEVADKLNGVVTEDHKHEAKDEEAKDESSQSAADDIGEIEPDHWSGTVPVFKPTMKQFQDFKLFMEKVDKYGMKSGIIKIIPPQEWKDSLPPLDDLVKQIRVREPIKQDIMGSNGTYRQVNILHQRSYNLPQWKQLCEQSEHQPPARRGERRANADRKPATRTRAAAGQSSASNVTSTPPAKRRKLGRVTRRSARAAKEETADAEDRPMTPESPAPENEEVLESVEQDPGVKTECDDEDPAPTVGRMGLSRQSKPKTQSVSARRKYSRREGSAMIDEAAFKDFDYRMDVSEFTPERCEELERIYWKTLTYAPPLYGADLLGTLFDDSTKIWNLNKLPNLLDVLGTKVPGVNTAYLYLGMWKATFAWHLEDVDLYSINYLHFGAPKQWYSISQADARRFEAAMKNIWPTEAKACDQFLRHKSFLISPAHLKQHYNITVNKCLSYPGEFVVTYPYGYHSGYNLGYNCAEAVNFALDSWLPMGKVAKKCQCAQAQDSVWVDVYEIERKLRGEETDYEETEDEEGDEEDEDQDTGLLSPVSSNTVRVKAPRRKRKRVADEMEPKAKRIRLRSKPYAELPCCLCPNDVPGAEILPTDDGRKAHRMCALYLPETYIETVDDKEIIANVAGIDKARLELKCLLCRSKKGACFQCSQKKCSRAYHATCAAAAGVFVEEAEVPVFGEDGTEYKEQAFEFSCRFHRTKRDRKAEGDTLETNAQVREAAAALKKYDICQVQYFRGDIFAGVVVENNVAEETLVLEILPHCDPNDRVEVEWKWLLVPDPADFRLPKASANAIPMPTCRKAKQEINAKRSADEAPRKDDEFGPGFVWAEFQMGDAVENSAQVPVDLSKEDRMWHYLGKTSTEAKAQYTEDPSRPRHNPKGNFLVTMLKPVSAARASVLAQPRPAFAAAQMAPTSLSGMVTGTYSGPLPGATTAKQEKPYLYKPRGPVAPTPDAQFTSHTFAVMAPSSPAVHQQVQHHQLAQQPLSSQPHLQLHISPQQGVQQHQGPPLLFKQYHPAGKDTQPKGSSAQYSSDRFAPVGGSNGFPKLPGLTWPPAHMKSGQYTQPQPGAWSASTGAAAPSRPYSTPMTSSALRSPSVRLEAGAAGSERHISAYQKYTFFQVNHNRDSSRYRTPYAPWGGFTNGYEGNLREFLIKAQKALSGGNGKSTTKQVPASLLQPLQPRVNTSIGSANPPHAGQASPYAQILPRPAAHSPQSPYSPSPMTATATYQAPPPRNQEHAVRNSPGRPYEIKPPGAVPLHPAIRPQYGAAWPQHANPPNQHLWPANPQTLAPTPSPPAAQAPAMAKPALVKQSHSPIPLPPYVRQMATASPSSSGPPPLTQPPEQATLQLPAPNPFAAPQVQAQSPGQVPSASGYPAPAQQRQLAGPGASAMVSPAPPGSYVPTGPQAAMQTTSPAQQQPAHPQATLGQTQLALGDGGSGVSPQSNGDSERAMVEKVMLNLRRASAHFETAGAPPPQQQ